MSTDLATNCKECGLVLAPCEFSQVFFHQESVRAKFVVRESRKREPACILADNPWRGGEGSEPDLRCRPHEPRQAMHELCQTDSGTEIVERGEDRLVKEGIERGPERLQEFGVDIPPHIVAIRREEISNAELQVAVSE